MKQIDFEELFYKVIVKRAAGRPLSTFWQSYSEVYGQWKLKTIISRLFGDELKKARKPYFQILDVGCGTGTDIFMLNILYKRLYNLKFIGIDISQESIDFANILREKRGDVNLFFQVGDAEKLDFENDMFDIVLCLEVLEHLPNPEKALKEIYRVLNPAGAVLVSTPNAGNFLSRFAPKKLRNKYDTEGEWCMKRHGNLALKVPKEERHISLLPAREWVKMSDAVGFRVEDLRRVSLFYGGPFFDRHVAFFGLLLVLDRALDYLPHTQNLSWDIILILRK